MARKKQPTYNKMIQMMGDMREKIDTEKDHIAEVLASQLDYETAMILGDFTDAELRRIASCVYAHIGMFANLAGVDSPKPQKLQAAENKPMVEGELRYNYGKNCWEVWGADADRPVGKLRYGTNVEFQESTGGNWQTAEVGMMVQDYWYMTRSNGSGPAEFIGLFDGLRVRLRNVDD